MTGKQNLQFVRNVGQHIPEGSKYSCSNIALSVDGRIMSQEKCNEGENGSLSHDSRRQCVGIQGLVTKDKFHGIDSQLKALCNGGKLKEAIGLLNSAPLGVVDAHFSVFPGLLQACVRLEACEGGKLVHSYLIRSSFKPSIFLGNTLINMYAKCGSIEDAYNLFMHMHACNIFTWTIMITAYVQYGYATVALKLFKHMLLEGMKPNTVSFVGIVNACSHAKALEDGKLVHAHVIRLDSCNKDIYVGNTLIDMYSRCSSIDHASFIFNNMDGRDIISWNAMIGGYVYHSDGKNALSLYQRMQFEGIKPNEITIICILSACACLSDLEQAKKIYYDSLRSGFELDLTISNTAIDMFSKCGSVELAQQVFDKMSMRNIVSWGAMIAGYVQSGCEKKALHLFYRMQQENVKPNDITFLSVMNACTGLEQGKQVHAHLLKVNNEFDTLLACSLISMYSRCQSIENAQYIFNMLKGKDIRLWNAIISAYCEHGDGMNGFFLYDEMRLESLPPNEVTYVNILSLSAHFFCLGHGKQVHASVIRSGYDIDVFIASTLIAMYAKCSSIDYAFQVFIMLGAQTVVSWNAMIAACTQNGANKEALKLFKRMKELAPNKVTLMSVLGACASAAALEQGKELHAFILKAGHGWETMVNNCLVDMYAKCGQLQDAQKVFDRIPARRDVISWNIIIAGYALHGHAKHAIDLFHQMQFETIQPNDMVLISILSACSHAQLVDEGCHYFHLLCGDNGSVRKMHHFACMVDLLGRAGHLSEAEDIIKSMPLDSSAVVCMSLLGACRNYKDLQVAEQIVQYILKIEPWNASALILLSNMYADAGRSIDIIRLREMVGMGT